VILAKGSLHLLLPLQTSRLAKRRNIRGLG
jgi:hypothetical protein